MGHRGLSHDRAPDEQLVVGRLSGRCGWGHLASCSRPPFSSKADRTTCRVRLAAGAPIPSVQFGICRKPASTQGRKIRSMIPSLSGSVWAIAVDRCVQALPLMYRVLAVIVERMPAAARQPATRARRRSAEGAPDSVSRSKSSNGSCPVASVYASFVLQLRPHCLRIGHRAKVYASSDPQPGHFELRESVLMG